MTITCDVADMQTTIEDEIPTSLPTMGQSLTSSSSYKTGSQSAPEEEEAASATVVLLSVKAVNGSTRNNNSLADFEEEERRINFAEGKTCMTPTALILVTPVCPSVTVKKTPKRGFKPNLGIYRSIIGRIYSLARAPFLLFVHHIFEVGL